MVSVPLGLSLGTAVLTIEVAILQKPVTVYHGDHSEMRDTINSHTHNTKSQWGPVPCSSAARLRWDGVTRGIVRGEMKVKTGVSESRLHYPGTILVSIPTANRTEI